MKQYLVPGDYVAVIAKITKSGQVCVNGFGRVTQRNETHATVQFNPGSETTRPLYEICRATRNQSSGIVVQFN